MTCPRCCSTCYQQQQFRPDSNPTQYRRRCHECGWDSGWRSLPGRTVQACLDCMRSTSRCPAHATIVWPA